MPTEFEATAHYLKDDHGDDIEPKATIPEAAAKATEETTDWGPPMLGALAVNLATFIGVFLLFPPVKKLSARPLFGAMLFAFAAGALLACAFFLLLFEATHLVAVGWSAEVDVLWALGDHDLGRPGLATCRGDDLQYHHAGGQGWGLRPPPLVRSLLLRREILLRRERQRQRIQSPSLGPQLGL